MLAAAAANEAVVGAAVVDWDRVDDGCVDVDDPTRV